MHAWSLFPKQYPQHRVAYQTPTPPYRMVCPLTVWYVPLPYGMHSLQWIIADGLSRDIQAIIGSLFQSGLRCIEPMTLDCRMKLFERACGSAELSVQWGIILEVLIGQGVMPYALAPVV
jgi:hypothetical protein